MREEEKEAFKVLKDLLEEFEDVEKWVIVNFSKKEFESLRICVNLIEKQQKEINELKYSITSQSKHISQDQKEIEKEKQYIDFYKDLCDKQQKEIKELKDIEADFNRRRKTCNAVLLKQGYISKDKIREKIKELEKEAFKSIAISEKINVLKDLLEVN